MKRMSIIVVLIALLTGCGNQTQVTNHSGMKHGGEHSEVSAIESKDVNVVWTFDEQSPTAGKEIGLNIQVENKDNKPIESFDINHEKKLHMIVVSKDFSYFNHIHPEYKGEGSFDIRTQFPSGGEYKLFADFIPTGGSAMTKSEWIKIEGEEAKQETIEPDNEMIKSVDGKEVTFSYNQLKAGEEVTLNFAIKDDKTKEPINNLEQYLGAVGHVVILTEDAEQYIHVHPMEEKATGPDAKFATIFPQGGIYKIWGQFQHEGQVFTVPFVVKVP